MSDVGRPSELTTELLLKIEGLVLQGKSMRDIAEDCEIPYKTMEGWVSRNFEGFRDKLKLYKNEWRLYKAVENIDEALELNILKPVFVNGIPARHQDGRILEEVDAKLVRIKIDNSHFVAETLGKDTYSKRQQLTDGDNRPLVPQDDARKVVESLKAAAGMNKPEKHEIKPNLNNGAEPVNREQSVAGNQNMV